MEEGTEGEACGGPRDQDPPGVGRSPLPRGLQHFEGAEGRARVLV